ncbi:MAG: cyclic nucleotide-binding domain-containing protein [Desulfuromonadales bacterium]
MKLTAAELCHRLKHELISFRYLVEEDIGVLAPFITCRQVQKGEVLWREGDPCDYVAFIAQGRIDIEKETEFEGKQVIVGVYGKGAIVGELCMLDQTPRSVTAVALEDSALLILSKENLERLIEENPALGVKLLKGMLLAVSTRLRKSFDRLTSIF